MRALIALLAVLGLSACISPTPREPEIPVLTLDGNGLQPSTSALRVDFGRAQTGVIDTVSRLLDERPAQISTNTQCRAGPVTSAQWANGLTLTFMDGNFLGWNTSDPALPVAGGFRPGQLRTEMPQISFQVTSLGTEFNRAGVFGLMDSTGNEVRVLWTGLTCFFG